MTVTTNGARDVACFSCRHSVSSKGFAPREGGGFHWQCSCAKHLPMPSSVKGAEDAEIVARCPGGDPVLGFQIGGYYSRMRFEPADEGPNPCMTWIIESDGEFPTDDESQMIEFHICDFRQIERFVAFWGKLLRERGVVTDD